MGFQKCFLGNTRQHKKDESLVRALVELINEDDSIDAERLFYISQDGVPVKKCDLVLQRRMCYEAFLLGVFHFAIMREEDATIGQESIDLWSSSSGGGKRKYQGNMGKNWPEIRLDYYQPPEENILTDDPQTEDQDTPPVADEVPQYEDEKTVIPPMINNQPVFFIQNGANSTQIAKVDNLTINL